MLIMYRTQRGYYNSLILQALELLPGRPHPVHSSGFAGYKSDELRFITMIWYFYSDKDAEEPDRSGKRKLGNERNTATNAILSSFFISAYCLGYVFDHISKSHFYQ